MRIREVRAHPFGPFDDECLDLAEGMTVITGLNESGKSSWHAAIYAALCGMRRGAGRRKEDQDFIQRHKPWGRDQWRASCVIDLPDGRTIALTHDLSGGVDSSARDANLGTDLTSEIIHEGAPDGSRWLGLDRRAFLAVASIRQAHILALTEDAGNLQEHLQRAAATAGTDETAAAALSALDTYSRDHVGTERSTTKPLLRARRSVERAEATHKSVVVQHQDWLEREERLVELRARAAQTRRAARAAEGRRVRDAAEQLADRLSEARTLTERHPSPPPDLRDNERLAGQVAAALHDWEQRPDPAPLSGASADDLEARLRSLPDPPTGDLEPADTVRIAHRELLDVQRRYEAHDQQRPLDPAGEPTTISEAELIDLARELETPIPEVDPALRAEAEGLRKQPTVPRARRPPISGIVAIVAAVVSIVTGTALLATGSTVPGGVGIGVGVLLGLAAVAMWHWPGTPSADDRALAAAEAKFMMAEQLAVAAQQRRRDAVRRAEDAGLEPNPAILRPLADQIRRTEDSARRRAEWETRERDLGETVAASAEALRRALAERGGEVEAGADTRDLDAAVARYEAACLRRRHQATESSQRPALEQAVAARRRAEGQLAEETERLKRARDALRNAATAVGLANEATAPALSEAELVDGLGSWQRERDRKGDEMEVTNREWTRLQVLLDGRSLNDLEALESAARKRFEELSRDLDPDLIEGMELGDDPETAVRNFREQADRLDIEAAEARRELELRAEQAPSVAEADEQLAAALGDLERVESLKAVLDTTRAFLTDAQERVHRNIAPVLAAKVSERLARVTAGRYENVIVNPETLQVQVQDADGRWQNADLLSHGTAEQIYLLLRIAMAEILIANGASCPLLLDDSTVQSDPQRTSAILDVLHEVSTGHQVILFSQEDDVFEWASENLGPRDHLHPLGEPRSR
ncbi:MAG: AAA family ATPase [Acidimicrobiia bacterium]